MGNRDTGVHDDDNDNDDDSETRRISRRRLEQALYNRVYSVSAPPAAAHPKQGLSWERETGRGIQHTFGEYRMAITNSVGTREEITIQEDCSIIATRVWDCAVVTSKWLEFCALSKRTSLYPDVAEVLNLKNYPELSSSSSRTKQQRPIQVLELGAGMGLVSISLAKMGAAVLSTEYGVAVRYLKENCRRNNVTILPKSDSRNSHSNKQLFTSGVVVCRELDWYKTRETLQTLFSTFENNQEVEAIFDLIVVTDCSLTEKDSKGVIEMIHKYGTRGQTKVVAGLCNHREGTPYFIETCQNDFHNVKIIATSELPPDYKTMRHTIVTFQV